MNNQEIIQSKSGQKIRLGAYLGSGQIAAVYKGMIEESGEVVAVKIPITDANSINVEYNLILELARRLEKTSDLSTVPKVELGQDTLGRDVLIIEYVDDQSLLGARLYEMQEDVVARDRVALYAAAQYAELLDALHSMSCTCQDRKTTDLRWVEVGPGFPMTGRLVVLDWNAFTKDSRDFAGDIGLFGENWYQLITGKISPLRLDPMRDALWRDGKVSFGLRYLLSQILSPAPGKHIKTAKEVSQKVQALLQLYERDAEDLYGEGRGLLKEIKNNDAHIKEFMGRDRPAHEFEKLTLFNPEKEWTALICLDLASLKGLVIKEKDECLKLVTNQGQRLVDYAEHFIEIDNYKQGQNAIRWAESVSSQTGNATFKLIVARRKILINAGQAALEDGLFHLREFWKELLKWIGQLEEAIKIQAGMENWQLLEQELSKKLSILKRGRGSPERTTRILDNLKHEVEWRTMLAGVKEREGMGRYQEALEMLTSKPGPTQAEEWFQKAIFDDLPSAFDLKGKLKEKVDWKKRLDDWSEEIKADRVIGHREYIDYLLRLRLKDAGIYIGAEEAEKARKWLADLRSFYFCFDGNNLERLFDAAVSLWQGTPEIWAKATRGEIAKHLNLLYKRAKDYAEMNVPAYDRESLRILNCLMEIRAGIRGK